MTTIGIAAFTARGKMLAERIGTFLSRDYEISCYETQLKEWCKGLFEKQAEGIVFIGAAGIAVRTIAPFIKSKTSDPAVLVIDEAGQYVISLLSGHIGGANDLALRIADQISACPVITTATDVNGLFAVDVFAKKNRLRIASMKEAKAISAALLRKEPVGLYCAGKIVGKVPSELTVLNKEELSAWKHRLIRILPEKAQISMKSADQTEGILNLYVRPYILGVGCRKDKEAQEIETELKQVLEQEQISFSQIDAMASIDLKKDEKGLLWISDRYQIPFMTYSAEVLSRVEGEFQASEFVKKTTGVDNVCERSALYQAGEHGRLRRKKYAKNGVTAAIAEREWSVNFYE